MDNHLITTINKAMLSGICADAISELERAVRKHPTFPGQLTVIQPDDAAEYLGTLRDMNDNGKATASTIFEEEFMEFIMECHAKRPTQAREELVQSIAMLLRTYCHLGHFTGQGVQE